MASTRAVALFRGINVGGNHMVPMAELRDLVVGLGFEDVVSCLNSGNIVFAASASKVRAAQASIDAAFEARFGYSASVLVRTAGELRQVEEGNPYAAEAAHEPKNVHAYFLGAAPSKEGMKRLAATDFSPEAWSLGKGVAYLHTPLGLGRSKLAVAFAKALGVPHTARNWRSVIKLRELLEA